MKTTNPFDVARAQDLRRAEETMEPIVIEMNIEMMADQPRRDAVEHAA